MEYNAILSRNTFSLILDGQIITVNSEHIYRN